MSNRILKFQPNEPITIALVTKMALPVKGNYGWQNLYACVDGTRFYASPELHEKIQQFEVKADECFTVCKRKQGRRVIWDLWLTAGSEKARAVEEMPAVAAELSNLVSMPQPALELAATGTEGRPIPAPRRSLGLAQPPNVIPFNIAFREVVQFVSEGLKESGEGWNDQSRQDLVSTVLISASQHGWIGLWERAK